MVDTWSLERAFERFTEAVPDDHWTDQLEKLANQVSAEIEDVSWQECEYAHADTEPAPEYDGESAHSTVTDLLRSIRMGYTVDDSLEDILESLRRELERNG
jgi:hypothetical protein